jgi:cyclopropane fatty-acyl-phospholipid synthase-like methyltransferase
VRVFDLLRVGVLFRGLRRAIDSWRFPGSEDYWENRYAEGGTSGDGSYGRLALFKAEFINDFVAAHDIASVLEFGCGDGAQLKLAVYPSYTGVDVSRTSIRRCSILFDHDPQKSFVHSDNLDVVESHDLCISLDVIYHLVEDSIFEQYMMTLFSMSKRFVIIYSSNIDLAHTSAHIRHRKFTDWAERNAAAWLLKDVVQNRYPADIGEEDSHNSFASFFVFERAD